MICMFSHGSVDTCISNMAFFTIAWIGEPLNDLYLTSKASFKIPHPKERGVRRPGLFSDLHNAAPL